MTERLQRWSVLALFAGFVLSLLLVHRDDNDGAVYIVIARHLAHDGTPFSLRYLSDTLPSFHEHPPLWIWVQAAALRLLPGIDLGLLGALCGIGTVAVTFALGRELLGGRAAFLGALLLATNDSFFRWSPTGKLDPPLVLLFTASVALLVRAGTRLRLLALGGLCAGVGALVKGVPAFGAPVAAALLLHAAGRREALSSPRAWLVVAVAALAPAALFVAYDQLAHGGAFWDAYVHGQLLASLSGRRSDGFGHLHLVRDLWNRGLPIVPLALASLWRARGARLGLVLWGALVVLAFSAASRAFWWYFLPALPPLALAAGAALDDLAGWARQERLAERVLPAVALALGLALLALLPVRLARLQARPCRYGSLPVRAEALTPADATLGLVSRPRDWSGQALLAEHTARDVVVAEELAALPERVVVALTLGDMGTPDGWQAVAHEGRTTLVVRRR
jgi:4-amino-4-deoxy-L-arabinose transferase-like glycosyltransferase